MNIGNITSDNFNLDGNGKDIQIEVYEQLIEQLQQENKKLNSAIQTYDILLKANVEENKHLKDNWNMLKEHLKNRYDNGTESISYRQVFMEIREAMQVLEIAQELEKGDSNE